MRCYFDSQNLWFERTHMVSSCPIRSVPVRFGPFRSDSVRSGPVRSGPIRSSPDRSGLVWFDLVWSGLVGSCLFVQGRWKMQRFRTATVILDCLNDAEILMHYGKTDKFMFHQTGWKYQPIGVISKKKHFYVKMFFIMAFARFVHLHYAITGNRYAQNANTILVRC